MKTQKDPKRGPVAFEIITRDSNDSKSLRFVDVAYQQSLHENKTAVFQVASNFNAVEGQTEDDSPDGANFAESYIWDRTQGISHQFYILIAIGPAASISAGGAAITRIYAPFFDSKKTQKSWAQTKARQVPGY